MLACARWCHPHCLLVASALKDRLIDAQAKVVVTADGGWRKDAIVPLKQQVDLALVGNGVVQNVLVVRRTDSKLLWSQDAIAGGMRCKQMCRPDCPAEPMDSEDMLFILYTSGTTGKPKAWCIQQVVTISTPISQPNGFLTFRIPTYIGAADVGWITGHSYIVYGPLSNGAMLMYRGAPRASNPGCMWDILKIRRYRVLHRSDSDSGVYQDG